LLLRNDALEISVYDQRVSRAVTLGSERVMPTYNINVRTASHIADTTPVERTTLGELRLEMARFVGELLKDHAELIWEDQDWQVDVTDEAGLILYVLNVSANEAAATTGTILRE
jgi:hypothetical protein